ncbi:MAG: N-acetylmuramoyl-L-alanine amidase, partial [Magnetococcales bacterium]|nr:N-acetylmuramoyl-L-alanine amidase [Magnetococcales bacterium]
FNAIGYHFVIGIDGLIEPGRPLATAGAHAVNFNARSIGVCLIGSDRFTWSQWRSLEELITRLRGEFPKARILGHRDLPRVAKECPGFDVREWLARGMRPADGEIFEESPTSGHHPLPGGEEPNRDPMAPPIRTS